MTDRDELLSAVAGFDDDDEYEDDDPVFVALVDLKHLNADDLGVGVRVQATIGTTEPISLASSLVLTRHASGELVALIEEVGWRKFWYLSLGVEEYYTLVREACESRSRSHGDVKIVEAHDEDVLFGLTYELVVPRSNLRDAWDYATAVQSEMIEAAEAVNVGVQDLFTSTRRRLEGWGADPLHALVDRMRTGTAQEKGRTLEELSSRLFNSVPGFNAVGHVVTATEEIDLRVFNGSDDPLWRRESHLLIAECKNWASRCGKNEFVLFKEKLANRVGRVSCGFLISWNGFAETVTREMLRGSREDLLVVPVSGADLRRAVRDENFGTVIRELHEAAVLL